MAAQGDDCYFFYYSTCTKGDSCQFRHCPEALGNEIVCSLWREGRCQRTICYYRHMEIDKNRSAIPCFWESQPSGCLKQHCPFRHMKPRGVDTSWTNSPTQLTTDVRNTLTSSGSVPVKKAIPAPVVEPVVVTPEEESDETSSVEVSPVKKIKFPSSSLLSAVKEEGTKSSDAGQPNFGIKTLSQIRQKNPRETKSSQNTTVVTGVQPGDLRKIVSLKGTSLSQLEGDKLRKVMQSGINAQKAGGAPMVNMRKRITLKTGDEIPLTVRRKLISSEKEEKLTVIPLHPGSDGVEKNEENSSSGIKTLAQIRQERFQKSVQLNKSGVSEQGDGGIKTLEQIRRERKVRAGMKMTEQGDAAIGRIESMETENSSKEESRTSDSDDYGIKSLDEIRKEKEQKFASGDGEADVPGVKSLEQIRRERIANRLGLRTDKESSVVSATGELDSEQSKKNQTLRTSVVSRLGKSAIGSQNTVHTRVVPSVKNDNLAESGRKIQIKERSELRTLQSAGQVLSQKIVTVKPAVSNSQEESVVKPKKRRVFVMGAGAVDEKDGQVTKAEDEGEDEVKSSLSKSRIRVGRMAMDGAEEKNRISRTSEDSEELENLDVKEEHKRKRILIKRNEGTLKNPAKRRADRQIYQPPAAKSKERVSPVKSRLGPKATSDTEKDDDKMKDGKDEKDKEVSVRKRPRITFHTDATSDHTESENSEKIANSRLSNMETLGGRTIKSGIVRIKPMSESSVSEPEHSEPQPSKKKKGGGLRERLLKQSEKFTVGVAGGKLDSTSEKPQETGEVKNVRRLISPEKDGVRDSDRGPTSGRVNVEPAEGSIGARKTEDTDDLRTDSGEGEQTVVSSTGSSDMSAANRGATDKGVPDVGSVDIIPNKRALPFTSEQKSLSPSNSILPDSTDQIIPSAVIGHPNTISRSQQLESNSSEPGAMDGKAQKESNGRSSKPRMSITDDDLDGLLDDVDDNEEPDQFEDDDDALLNELEDLINA